MSAGAAALLAMGLTAYLAIGTAWSIMVAVARLVLDQPVRLSGFIAQLLLWPFAVWLSARDLRP